LNSEVNTARKRSNSAIIAADVRRFGHVINTDGFSVHTAGPRKSPVFLSLVDLSKDARTC
jgi:hypothetical protein